MTVVETAEFLRHATRLMTDAEREELVAFIGANPEAGEIMPETGEREEDPVGPGWYGQARRHAGDLLLSQRATAGVLAHCLLKEPEGESQ